MPFGGLVPLNSYVHGTTHLPHLVTVVKRKEHHHTRKPTPAAAACPTIFGSLNRVCHNLWTATFRAHFVFRDISHRHNHRSTNTATSQPVNTSGTRYWETRQLCTHLLAPPLIQHKQLNMFNPTTKTSHVKTSTRHLSKDTHTTIRNSSSLNHHHYVGPRYHTTHQSAIVTLSIHQGPNTAINTDMHVISLAPLHQFLSGGECQVTGDY